jgi:hypothetical protein
MQMQGGLMQGSYAIKSHSSAAAESNESAKSGYPAGYLSYGGGYAQPPNHTPVLDPKGPNRCDVLTRFLLVATMAKLHNSHRPLQFRVFPLEVARTSVVGRSILLPHDVGDLVTIHSMRQTIVLDFFFPDGEPKFRRTPVQGWIRRCDREDMGRAGPMNWNL